VSGRDLARHTTELIRAVMVVAALALFARVAVAPQSAHAGDVIIILEADFYGASHDQPIVASGPSSVLANDTIPVGYVAFVTLQPAHGTLDSFGDDGSFTYTPDPGFVGQETFLYHVTPDPNLLIAGQVSGAGSDPIPPGQVFLNLTNSPAQANDDAYTIDQDTVLNEIVPGVLLNDLDPDGDPITVFDVVAPPAHGTLNAINADGSFTYTPNPGFFGTDTFDYRVTDGIDDPGAAAIGGSGASADEIATVTIIITGLPTPTPTATATEEPTVEPTTAPTEPTATPEPPAPTPSATADNTGGVTELPDTGSGSPRDGDQPLLWVALLMVAMLAASTQRHRRFLARK
jgi:hypothetical protein